MTAAAYVSLSSPETTLRIIDAEKKTG